MMVKGTLFLLVALVLAMPAAALDDSFKKASPEAPGKYLGELANPAFTGRSVFEGFELAVPPAGWDAEVLAPTNTWMHQAEGWAIEGEFCAGINWTSEAQQNEAISFEYPISVDGGDYILSFWSAGSTGNPWDLNVSETVEINGVEIWDFDTEVPYGHSFEYFKFYVDLSAYDGQTVTIGFRYQGIDGDGHFFDAVAIDNGLGWDPEPGPDGPLNDTCEGAMDNGFTVPAGQFNLSGDTTTAYHHYALTADSCSPYGFHGPDLVWVVCMEEGDVLDVEMLGQAAGFDAVFFLITDCGNPVDSCVAMGDEPEVIHFTAESADTYYLVAGGWAQTMVGEFTLNGTLSGAGCGTVATDHTTWGSLKSLYR